MKHLIALSMKYIRRQKMRTFLTFMCITLSAFILTTICTYGSSLYTSLYNLSLQEDGTWEVDISSWVEKSKDRSKAEDIIAHHAVVDDHFFSDTDNMMISSDEDSSAYSCFEISDGKNRTTTQAISINNVSGNDALLGKFDKMNFSIPENTFSSEKKILVPAAIRDMGYSEGDTITLTIRPYTGIVDESADIVKQARAQLKEKYGTEYCKGDKRYEGLTKEERKKAYNGTILKYLRYKMRLTSDTIPLTDMQYGKPAELTFKIGGFVSQGMRFFGDTDFIIINNSDEKLSLKELHENNPEIEYESAPLTRIRLTDNCDYDEALEMLFKDLGFNYDTQFLDSFEFPHYENNLLLALEVKSPYAMYQMMVFIVPILIVLLIGWFIARFVIDNTFEMAVQERSTHFAAMRIMGASKTQVAFVVLYEALFYCLTAIPLGMILAVIVCRMCFNSLRKSGIDICEFSAKPLFLAIAAFLAIIALFISAYTSAMWASRKLSPAEALNFGKPKSRKRKLRKKKSKLNLSSRKWLRRYTKKNIKASKSRFVIATITMALGVLMFTFTLLVGTCIHSNIDPLNDEFNSDFYLQYIAADPENPLEESDRYFKDSSIFSEYYVNSVTFLSLNDVDGSGRIVAEKLMRIHPEKNSGSSGLIQLYAIDENEYNDKGVDKLTGMSYEEFRSSKGTLYNNSVYGNETIIDEDTHLPKKLFDESYTDLGKGYTITDYNRYEFRVIGKMSSKLMDHALIIPVEAAAQYGLDHFDIELKVKDSKHYDAAIEKINGFREKADCFSFDNIYMSVTGLQSLVGAILKIVLSFLISIWLVGILSMVNSVNTSVLNRSRELMMLRSVGMSRKQLRKSVMLETIMFSSTAAIIGNILGIGFYILTLWDDMQLKYLFSVPAVAALSLSINILISILAALPAIKNLNNVETIAQAAND
ncbi:MAG: FtsX-like permease family protein [Ruminococcus sp.]|nr:FtsX-like permease family protein [Ruminococcus sp.]